jgi:hypothetical protein
MGLEGHVVRAGWLAALLACSHTETAGNGNAPASPGPEAADVAPDIAWTLPRCDQVGPLPNLKDLEMSEAHSRFGVPTSQESFQLGERRDEFHITLQNTYPLSDPKNASVQVREQTWAHGDCRLTLWFHLADGAWRSFEVLRWPAGAEF